MIDPKDFAGTFAADWASLERCVAEPRPQLGRLEKLVKGLPGTAVVKVVTDLPRLAPQARLSECYLALANGVTAHPEPPDDVDPDELYKTAFEVALDPDYGMSSDVLKKVSRAIPDKLVPDLFNRVIMVGQPDVVVTTLKALAPRLSVTDVARAYGVTHTLRALQAPSGQITRLTKALDARHFILAAPAIEIQGPREGVAAAREPVLAVAPARTVSTGFSSATAPNEPWPTSVPLPPSTQAYFWLNIGEPVGGAIDESLVEIDVTMLPAEARLEVALFSCDGWTSVSGRTGVFRMQDDLGFVVDTAADLPPEGAVPADVRQQRLYFDVTTPASEGRYRLRCGIHFRGAVLQSREVSVLVSRDTAHVPGALRTRLDYAVNQRLDPATLQHLEPHRLSLMMNDGPQGSHDFYVFASDGGDTYHRSAHFDGHEIQDLLNQCRRALRRVAWGTSDDWHQGVAYRYEADPNFDGLCPDLHGLAKAGVRTWDALAIRLGGGAAGAKRLRERMRAPGAVQLALKEGSRTVPPLAMIYDYALDPALPASSVRLCESFMQAYATTAPLAGHECFQGRCPNAGAPDVVCPSGFWGFRHALGIPLPLDDVEHAGATPLALVTHGAPTISIGVCTDPQFTLLGSHVAALRGLGPFAGVRYNDTRAAALRDMMEEPPPHLLYFYCHGGVEEGTPFIQVGPLSDPHIEGVNLQDVSWTSLRPLVFLNGCHTTHLEPERAIDLVSGFVHWAGAAAVVGTEITVFEPLATRFAEAFFTTFLGGENLGASIRAARLSLLKEHLNPLGLVYLPYGFASLHLHPLAA